MRQMACHLRTSPFRKKEFDKHKMKAVIYARYSSDNQREESIEGQLRECIEYAKFNGIDVVNSYIDRAYSAKTDHRPEFQRMVKDSFKGLFDLVIVWKLDRFARNRYDSAHYKTILKKNGVKVLSAKETISEGAEGILLEAMLEGYAEYYSIELGEKVKRGLTENALKAKVNGGTRTFGYTVDADRHYQIDPPAALIVREVFQLYADGKTMKEIKDILNARNLTNSRFKDFNFNNVQRMLSNRKYIGEYRFGEIIIPNAMPAIVDKELFDKVQNLLAKNKKAPARHKAEDDYLLTTKLFCGRCGAIMNGESGTSVTKAKYHYYKCVNSRKKTCKKKPVSKEKLENAVIRRIIQFLEDENAIEELTKRVYELQFAENTYIPKLEAQIAETQKRIDNLVKAAEQGFVSESAAKRLKELEETKKKQELALIQEQIKTPIFTQEQIAFGIYKFRKLDVTTQEGKQALIDGFVNAIYLYDDHAKLILNYKNDVKTIPLEELNSSDFNSLSAPTKSTTINCGAFCFLNAIHYASMHSNII